MQMRYIKIKMIIAPSLLSCDFLNIGKELGMIEEAGAKMLHLDIMDGHFVPNLTFGPPIISQIRKKTSLLLHAHIMALKPESLIKPLADAGCDMVTVHYEASIHLHRALEEIRSYGMKAGVAINPTTPAVLLDDSFQYCDHVLVMSVDPGFGGQSFLPGVLSKISYARSKDAMVIVDGGIDSQTGALAYKAGAETLVCGSYLFKGIFKENFEALTSSCIEA